MKHNILYIIPILIIILSSCSRNKGPVTSVDQCVKDAEWVTIPDVRLPELIADAIPGEYPGKVNEEIHKLHDGYITDEYKLMESEEGCNGPSASYMSFLNNNVLSLVIWTDRAGYNTDNPDFTAYNIDVQTGNAVSNDSLMKIAGITPEDIRTVADYINDHEVGFQGTSIDSVAKENFNVGNIEYKSYKDYQMYLQNDSLIMISKIVNLPYGDGKYTICIPVAEVLAKGKEPKPAASEYGLSDRYGTKFLIMVYFDDAIPANAGIWKKFNHVIYGSKVYDVKYAGIQEGDEKKDNGRQIFYNFDNLRGLLFENTGEPIQTKKYKYEHEGITEPVLLCNDNFIKENELVEFHKVAKEPASSVIKELEQHYQRKIKRSALTFAFGNNDENKFYSVQFEDWKDSTGLYGLGVYALYTKDGICYKDDLVMVDTLHYPGSYWRIDDSGKFYLENMPVAIMKNGNAYSLLMMDKGAEGVYAYTLTQKGDSLINGERDCSFYQSPI